MLYLYNSDMLLFFNIILRFLENGICFGMFILFTFICCLSIL